MNEQHDNPYDMDEALALARARQDEHPLRPFSTPRMRIVCMYCLAMIGYRPCAAKEANAATHGICDACWPKACEEFGLPKDTPKPE